MTEYYNSLDRIGSVVKDPPHICTLEVEGFEEPGDLPLGGCLTGVGAQELIGYLAMRGWGIPIMDQDAWIEKHKPVLVVTITSSGKQLRFDHEGNPLPKEAEEVISGT